MNRFGSLLLVHEGEGRQVGFYLLLFAFLGAAMAVGKGSADAMFLKRYGIEYLPVMYLILSVVLAVTFTGYAAFVDRIAPEKFFFTILVLQIFALVLFWLVIVYAGLDIVYPAYYILYELVSDLILVHAAFYIGRNLNTLQSKRLMPLVFSGYQAGMIAGGVVLVVVVPSIGVNHAVLIWAVFIAAALLLLIAWHKRYGISPHFVQPPKLKVSSVTRARDELRHGLRFMKESSLLKNASLALFFMVIMFYTLTFSVNKIYSEQIHSEKELAAFFGLLLAVTNVTALLLQIFITGRLIEKFGVYKTKLVYPIVSIIAFTLLLFSPGFYTALIASFNKDSIMPAFRNPTRQMFFNVLPDHMQGRARATSIALVLPLALFVCGLLVLYLQKAVEQWPVIALGLFCALMYFIFCYRMGRDYVAALIDNLRQKLYIPREDDYTYFSGADDEVYQELLRGLYSKDGNVCLSYARLLMRVFPQRAAGAIMDRMTQAEVATTDQLVSIIGRSEPALLIKLLQQAAIDDHCRATVYRNLFRSSTVDCSDYIAQALQHASPRIQAAGIYGTMTGNVADHREQALAQWRSLLHGDIAASRSAVELIALIRPVRFDNRQAIIDSYALVITRVLKLSDAKYRKATYRYLSDWQWSLPAAALDIIRQDTESLDPGLRSAVAGCLFILDRESQRQSDLWKLLGDGHGGVRKAAINALNRHLDEPASVYYGWLLINKPGSTRAQKAIMEYLLKTGLTHIKVRTIVDVKIRYAAQILSVIHALAHSVSESSASRIILEYALVERLVQTLDLALMGLEPRLSHDTIAVIRAGISSRDKRQQANAREALNSLGTDHHVDRFNCLIEHDYSAMRRQGMGRVFSDMTEALEWCANGNDFWLSECGSRALRDVTI